MSQNKLKPPEEWFIQVSYDLDTADVIFIEAIKFFESSLMDSGLNISKIILFGSQAKGNQTKESDIDLVIISDDFKDKDIFERANITKDAEIKTIKKFLIPFDIVTLTPEEFENSMFFESTKEDKIIYA